MTQPLIPQSLPALANHRAVHYNEFLRPNGLPSSRGAGRETGTAGTMNPSIFFDVSLPSAATWFYFSGLLAVALFFKFSRLLSVRNLDVLTLFLLMPGMLLALASEGRDWWAYFWLLLASGYFLVRCLLDLVLVRRPALAPNLSPAGLFWLAGTLFASLIVVPVPQTAEATP